jgi:hypothetical protein
MQHRQPINVKDKQSQKSERAREGAGERDTGRGEGAPRAERRSAHRVADDQGSGHGAMTALARLKMQERRQRIVPRLRDADDAL